MHRLFSTRRRTPGLTALGLLLVVVLAMQSHAAGPRGTVAGIGDGAEPVAAKPARAQPPRSRSRLLGALPGANGGLGEPPFPRRGVASLSGMAPREFYFTRAHYSGHGWRRFYSSWSVDFPKADVQFLIGLKRLVNHLDAYDYEHPLRLSNPNLAHFPFLYAVEVGQMALTKPEVEGLRRYLLAGGFLVVDDFWGTAEWENFESEIRRVLPGFKIVDLPLEHPIFHCFYDVKEIVQVPNVGQGRAGGPTHEQDGFWPVVRGISDHEGRLMVVINWNSDLGDAWEWAEDPYYPLRFSTYAYQMGVNLIIYAMSH